MSNPVAQADTGFVTLLYGLLHAVHWTQLIASLLFINAFFNNLTIKVFKNILIYNFTQTYN